MIYDIFGNKLLLIVLFLNQDSLDMGGIMLIPLLLQCEDAFECRYKDLWFPKKTY